jgi:hypothetical protein
MYMTCRALWVFGLLSLSLWRADLLNARQSYGIPLEFEASGDDAMGVSNAGVAISHGTAAVFINPALLGLVKDYRANATYYWPERGREFYQIGVVDGTTAKLVAGAVYTGFSDKYEFGQQSADLDSPVARRISVGLAYPFTHFVLGLSGHYVEAQTEEQLELKPYKGISLGIGFLALLTDEIRLGLSYQNFNNAAVKPVTPTVARAGLSWVPKSGYLEMFLDYRQRVNPKYEGGVIDDVFSELVASRDNSERESMLLTGGRVRVYNVLQLGLGYGQQIGNDSREQMSAQIGLVHNEFSFSYAIMRTIKAQEPWHASINLSVLFSN